MGLALPVILSACGSSEKNDPASSIKFYASSSDGKVEHSIYLCELDPQTESIAVLDSFAGAVGPSYMAVSPDRNTLYTVDNRSVDPENKSQSVNAFSIKQEDLGLKYLNNQSSEGRGPCHVYASDEHLFVANYSSGHATSIALSANGELALPIAAVSAEGSGPNERRQKGPHAHQVMLDPSGSFLLVPDLGTDKVMNYLLDSESGALTPNPAQAWLELPPGAGPRHLAFHPSGKFVYVLSEMNSMLTACSFNEKSGVLEIINAESIVKEGFSGNKQAAAVRVHPNGRFVYASNRDENDNLATYRIKQNGGIERIQLLEGIPHWPRDFNITPDGKYMLIAGARSNEVQLYKIDAESGKLSATEAKISVPVPTCVLFVE